MHIIYELFFDKLIILRNQFQDLIIDMGDEAIGITMG